MIFLPSPLPTRQSSLIHHDDRSSPLTSLATKSHVYSRWAAVSSWISLIRNISSSSVTMVKLLDLRRIAAALLLLAGADAARWDVRRGINNGMHHGLSTLLATRGKSVLTLQNEGSAILTTPAPSVSVPVRPFNYAPPSSVSEVLESVESVVSSVLSAVSAQTSGRLLDDMCHALRSMANAVQVLYYRRRRFQSSFLLWRLRAARRRQFRPLLCQSRSLLL